MLGLEGIVSKRLASPYKSGPCKSWIKVRNPKSSRWNVLMPKNLQKAHPRPVRY
jgi:ATP-dependent DNA ligase